MKAIAPPESRDLAVLAIVAWLINSRDTEPVTEARVGQPVLARRRAHQLTEDMEHVRLVAEPDLLVKHHRHAAEEGFADLEEEDCFEDEDILHLSQVRHVYLG